MCRGWSVTLEKTMVMIDTEETNITEIHLKKKLLDGLSSFASQPTIWVDRTLSTKPEIAEDADAAEKVTTDEIISNTKSIRIKAPPQFGLTCLARYLVCEARIKSKSYWLYLDSRNLKASKFSIENSIQQEINLDNQKKDDIACVILDSWSCNEKEAHKLLEKVIELFPDRRIIDADIRDCKSGKP